MRSGTRPARRIVAAVAGLLAFAVCPAGPSIETLPGLPPEQLAAVHRLVEAEIERLRIPGLSVAVAVDLRLVWTEGFGMADVENSVPATPETIYRLGSITKPITAVAVLQLAQSGRMDLDSPIQKYVPSFPEKPWPITARELLSHTSGIRHYRSLAEINSVRHYDSLLEPLKIFQDEPLLFEPGTRYAYSTYGYNVLGAAVEGASGTRFLDYLSENVFAPAGMRTIRQDDLYTIVPHRAHGYRLNRSGALENCATADTSNKLPGGGLISTSADLVRFAVALNHGLLLKREALARMYECQRTRDGRPTNYGLGWRIFERGGRKWVGHGGAQQGVSSTLLASPADGVAVSVMANLEGADLAPLCAEIAAVVE